MLIQILTNLEELSFLTVLAFPKASKKEIDAWLKLTENNFTQKNKANIIFEMYKSQKIQLVAMTYLSKISTETHLTKAC